MAITTFSGPVKAGSIREGATANTGFVLMAQSAVIDIIGATATTAVGIIPANSQIVDVILNVTTVSNDGGTATVKVGHSGDDDEYLANTNVKALATTRGTIGTDGTDIGSSDQTVNAVFTAANGDGTTGAATVTVLYIQNNNLS
jgi:stage V sporulation protein SpoVS